MKRLTDTGKWVDPWFRRLCPAHKLAWLYILDSCDPGGIWAVDFALFKTLSGSEIDEQKLLAALKGRAKELPRRRWWIPKFITFQYGELSKGCRRHLGVLEIIRKNELDAIWNDFLAHKNEIEPEQNEIQPDDEPDLEAQAEEIYQAFPLLVGKPRALLAIKKSLKLEKFEVLLAKTKDFASRQPANLKFCPHPASWFNAARYNDHPSTWNPSQGNGRQPDLFGPPKKSLLERDIEALARQAKKLL